MDPYMKALRKKIQDREYNLFTMSYKWKSSMMGMFLFSPLKKFSASQKEKTR